MELLTVAGYERSGCVAGPVITEPFRSKREPWQVQVNILLANVQFLSHWEWVQTDVRALKVLPPMLNISTFEAVTNAHPPAEAKEVAIFRSTVTALAVDVIPVPEAGGVTESGVLGSVSSEEQPVKKATPKRDITAREPDFFRNSLLSSVREPV